MSTSTTSSFPHIHSLDDWERVIRVQLTGSFLCARAALRYMIANGLIILPIITFRAHSLEG